MAKIMIQMYHNENKFYDFYVTCYIQGQINLSISTTPSAFQIQQNKGLNHCFSTLTPWRQKLLNFYSLIKTILTYISQKTERVIFQNNYIYTHTEIFVLSSSYQFQQPWKTEMKIFSKQVYFGIFRCHFPVLPLLLILSQQMHTVSPRCACSLAEKTVK